MPDRESHLLQASRTEAFLARIQTPDQPYREWIVVTWFYICLHYVDAFLASKGHAQISGHSDRFTKMLRHKETHAIFEDFERLYKESKEARYQCTQYTGADLAQVEPLYTKVRSRLRAVLAL